jgi:hypothetical protein
MTPKPSLYRAAGAFVVCFAIGAGLSILTGTDSKIWVPAGFTTSSLVAWFAYGARPKI